MKCYLRIALIPMIMWISFTAQAQNSASADATNSGGLVQLVHKLDEPRGICFDIVGFRDSIDYHVPMQAHTCKPDPDNREDGLFVIDYPLKGNIYNKTYDRCLDAVEIVERGNVFMRPCTDQASQQFDFSDDHLALTAQDGSELCLAVSPSPSHPSVLKGTMPEAGVTFVARTMALVQCDLVDAKYSKWSLPK